ncbi:dihydroorotase, multifunctional complex type [Xenococcus sp. PCC 7305]|uniref:dihydroorotase n=1 Tax=Xenococcus sp. PCC 7305 TaxID=102125 RepID=UPI0002AC7117|nr:dihydroorotase [Xenococcus sp. PCC 7305]ELS05129.1 dihydroorotase, multifunctional complex type [Xenococcus sp. PCC 7305]
MNGKSPQLLRQVRLLDPTTQSDRLTDVLIINHKIASIGSNITDFPTNTEIIDAQKLVLGTGLVDLYSHSGEPGNETRETLETLVASAAAGGFTQIAVLPDTSPRIDNAQILTSLQQKIQYLANDNLPRVHLWSAISAGGEQKQMAELAELSSQAIGFSDRFSLTDLPFLKQVLEYLQPLQKPLAIDVSANELTAQGVIREGINSVRYGLVGNPGYSEASASAAILELVTAINTPIHLMRVSTARSVELIAAAKTRGVPVTASTTWMHLLFSTADLASYDPNLRLEPPLGNPSDLQILQEGCQAGIIDAIAIDHQGYSYEEKTVAFSEAPSGAIGLQLALPILWQKFVATGQWSALQLWQALSTKPQLCLQQTPRDLAIDSTEFTLFDPEKVWTVNHQNIHSLSSNTPWWGQQIRGQVIV